MSTATQATGGPTPSGETLRVPKYWELKGALLDSIRLQDPGAALPPERTLAVDFGVSRTTVRQAIQELVLEGRLERVQGSGTFVARPKVAQALALTSYTEDMRAQGLEPSARVLTIDVIDADSLLASRLGMVEGASVLRISRLRLANDEPMAIETSHLEKARFPRLRTNLAKYGSLYTALQEVYNVRLVEAEETIETAHGSPEEANVLGVEVGLPMLLLSRHSFDADGPVEWVRSIYRGDRYKFVTRLSRPGAAR